MKLSALQTSVSSMLRDSRFWRASGLLMLANLIATGLAFVRTPLLTWVLPKSEVGMIGVVASWLPFVQLLSLPGLNVAVYHYVAKGHTGTFTVSLAHRLRWSLLSVAGFLVGAAYWRWRGDVLLAWMFLVAGLTYPVAAGLAVSAKMLEARENFFGLFWYRLGDSLTKFAGFLPLALSVWWASQVVTFYAANQVATAFMHIGITLWLLWRLRQTETAAMPPKDAREMVRYGRHLTALSGISVLHSRTDALLVSLFLPLDVVADYAIALVVETRIRQLWGVYTTVRYPPLVRLPTARRKRRMFSEGALVWSGFIGIGLLLALAAHLLVPLVLPSEYGSSLGYMNWIIAATIVAIPGGLAEIFFRTEQDEKRQYVMRTVAGTLSVVLPLVLVFRWGAYGVIVGRFIANLVFSLLGVWLAVRTG